MKRGGLKWKRIYRPTCRRSAREEKTFPSSVTMVEVISDSALDQITKARLKLWATIYAFSLIGFKL